jgi:hypothetical protein
MIAVSQYLPPPFSLDSLAKAVFQISAAASPRTGSGGYEVRRHCLERSTANRIAICPAMSLCARSVDGPTNNESRTVAIASLSIWILRLFKTAKQLSHGKFNHDV